MAAVMTSCNNDDADYIMQPAPVAPSAPAAQPKEDIDQFDGILYFAATPMQLEMFNNKYTVYVGSESFEVNLEDLQETSVIPEYKAAQIEAFRAEYGEESMKIFSYRIPVAVKGRSDIKAYPNFSIKDGIEMPEEFTFIAGMCDKQGNGKLKQTIGIPAKKGIEYLKIVNDTTCNLY